MSCLSLIWKACLNLSLRGVSTCCLHAWKLDLHALMMADLWSMSFGLLDRSVDGCFGCVLSRCRSITSLISNIFASHFCVHFGRPCEELDSVYLALVYLLSSVQSVRLCNCGIGFAFCLALCSFTSEPASCPAKVRHCVNVANVATGETVKRL